MRVIYNEKTIDLMTGFVIDSEEIANGRIRLILRNAAYCVLSITIECTKEEGIKINDAINLAYELKLIRDNAFNISGMVEILQESN